MGMNQNHQPQSVILNQIQNQILLTDWQGNV